MKKLLLLMLVFGCTNKETAQNMAEKAVKKYVRQNANDPSSYKPIGFGKLDSIYTNDSGRYWQLAIVRKNLVNLYNDANSKGKKILADSLRDELININKQMEEGKTLSGLKIYHVSQGKNELDEMVMNRGSFYLDTNFQVKEFVMTEDSLLTENE